MADKNQILTDEQIGLGASKPAAPKTLSDSDVGFEPPARGFKGWAQDVAATAVKGAIAVPEMVVGLADIPTGGRVGKFLENEGGAVGFRPKQAKEIVNEWHSDATKEAQRKFQEADGFWDKAGAVVQNPSLIATAVGESIPSMLAGGVMGRGALAAARGLGFAATPAATAAGAALATKQATIAGAAGEGLTMAGSAAEKIRQETEDGLLTPMQSGAALLTGAVGGAISRLSGGLQNKLGIGDADTMAVQGLGRAASPGAAAVNPLLQQTAARSIPNQVVLGAINEGLLEELPQSLAEQMLQNVALGKPWHQDLDAAAIMGTLSGGVMGAGAAGFNAYRNSGAPEPVDPGSLSPKNVAEYGNLIDTGIKPELQQQYRELLATAQDESLHPRARADAAQALHSTFAPEGLPKKPATEALRAEYEARLADLQAQEQGEAPVRQTTPESVRKVIEDRRAAEMAAGRAVAGPDDEIYQSTGATDPVRQMVQQAADAGGALSSAAVVAIDTGAAGQMQQAADQAQAQTLAQEQAKASKKADPAAKVDASTGEIAGGAMASWSDDQLSSAFRGAQDRKVRIQIANELQRRRTEREQADLQAELQAEQAAMGMPDLPDNAFASVSEDAGEAPADLFIDEPATRSPAPRKGNSNGAQAAQAQQAEPKQPAQPANPPAAGPAFAGSAGQGEAVGLPVRQSGQLTNAAPTANNGAQAAPAPGPQTQTGGEAASPAVAATEALRAQLREVEDKILRAAPGAMAAGGGDIEAAMKSPKVPVTLKAKRKKLQDQLRAAPAAGGTSNDATKFRRNVLEMITRDDGAEVTAEGEAILKQIPQDLQAAALEYHSIQKGLAQSRELLDDDQLNDVERDASARLQQLAPKVKELYAAIDTLAGQRRPEAQTAALPAPKDENGAAPDSRDATGKQASWVIKDKATGAVVTETFDKAKVQALNTAKYEAVPVAEHLASLSAKPASTPTSSAAESLGADAPKSWYTLPDGDINDEWRDAKGRGTRHPDFEPTARQQMLMDAVGKVLDAGAFYNDDVQAKLAGMLGVGKDVLASNRTGVVGGDFGYDVYLARHALETKRATKNSEKIAQELNLSVGDSIGTLMFLDFKVTTGVTITSKNDTGLIYGITGKRGAAVLNGEVGVDNIKGAIERAHERGKRKDSYADFIASRKAQDAAAQPAPKKPSRSVLAKLKEQARAEHFAPGNVIASYGGGHDRVVSYQPSDEQGNWSVTVRAVQKLGDTWVDVPNERERTHSTQPDAKELTRGPVGKVSAPAPSEIDHNGTRIYQSRIKFGEGEVKVMWAVESATNKAKRMAGERTVSGDTLHETLEQARAAADREAKRDAADAAFRAEQDAQDKARKEAEEARKAANRGKSVVERHKDAVLSKQVRDSERGDVVTRREWVERKVEQGLEPKITQEDKIKPMSRLQFNRASNAEQAAHDRKIKQAGKKDVFWLGDFEVTKIEHDYAQGLKAQRAAAQQAEAAPAASSQRAADDFLPEGWTKSINGYTKRPVYRMEQGGGQPFAVVTQVEGMQYERQIRHGDKQLTVSNQTGALSEVLAKAEAELTRMTQADSVTHQDPGEKPEAATKAVVSESLKTAARNEDTKPSEMRKWLLAEIEKEMLAAPDRADYDETVKRVGEKDAISMYTGNGMLGKNTETGFITFDVPGDGKFKVRNSMRGLLEFRKNVNASGGFKDSGQKTVRPPENKGALDGGSKMDAITNMIEEGDFEAARDYAEAVGIKLDDVKVPKGDRKPQWDAFRKNGTLPPEPVSPSKEWKFLDLGGSFVHESEAKQAVLTRTADGSEYVATVKGRLDGTSAKYAITKDGKQHSAMTTRMQFSEALVMAEAAMPKANDKPAAGAKTASAEEAPKLDLMGFTRTPMGNGIFQLRDGNLLVEVQPTLTGLQAVHRGAKSSPRLTEQQAIEWAANIRSEAGAESGPADPAPKGRTYLLVPFEEKDLAKVRGAKWDAEKKAWYADPISGGMAEGEINVNLTRFIPEDRTADDRFNYYGDKGIANVVALNAQQRDGVPRKLVKRKHPDEHTMFWSVVPDDQKAEPSIPEGYKPAGEPFYREGKLVQGYAPFNVGDRVTMKDSAGQSGVIESLASPDDSGVFASAVVKFDNGMEQMVQFGKLESGGDTRTDTAANVAEGDTARLGAGNVSVAEPTQHQQADSAVTKAAKPKVTRFVEKTDMVETKVEWQSQGESGNWERLTTFDTLDAAKDAAASQGYDTEAIELWESEWSASAKRFLPAKLKTAGADPVQSDAPKLTHAEAKALMEWQDMGQSAGVKKHALHFYESQADKDANRGRMTLVNVTKGDKSASNWFVEGDDKPFAMLGMAKKRAEELGMLRAMRDGFVVSPLEKYDVEARAYGFKVRPDGSITKDGKELGPVVKEVRSRLVVESSSGSILFTGPQTGDALGKFIGKFWLAEKKSVPGAVEKQEAQPAETPAEDAADVFPMQEAASSYSGISHSGTQRAKADAAEFEAYIERANAAGLALAETDEQKAAIEQATKDLRADYLAAYRRMMSVRAGTYSGFVAGRSGLNAKQADQRNSAYDRAIDAFVSWQKENDSRVRRAALDARTDEAKQADIDAARAADDQKAQAKEDSDLTLMRKILNWKKGGEPVAIGKAANLNGVNLDKAGYPSSVKLSPTDGSTLSDDKFDLAALFRRKGMSVPDSKRRVRELVDAVRAEDGAQVAAAKAEPSAKAEDSKTPNVDRHMEVMEGVRAGTATPEQFKASFNAVVDGKQAILAELDTKTKVELLRAGGAFLQMRYASEKKSEVAEAFYRQLVGEYTLGEGVNYGMGKGAYEAAVRRMVEATDEAKLQRYLEERKAVLAEAMARRAARVAAITNPQTLADFREVIGAKISDGMSQQEAFLALTPEQRIKYDTLAAESTRERREELKRKAKTQVATAGNTSASEVIATKHTKLGHDLFVVKLADRVERDEYLTLNNSAKRLGGSYSSFRGNGAIPGFQFRNREAAEAFRNLVEGDTTQAQELAAQRRDAFEDDRSQTAVERLRAMAEKLEAQAEEEENRQRKTNTAKRARYASSAMAGAAADKAKAKTMRNIADAIEAGNAKFLDEVRTKTQVDMLTAIVATAKSNELRAKYPSYADQEKRRGEPPTAETADFAEFPSYTSFRSDLASLARQMLEVEGTKKLGQRLMSVADDVTDTYLEFAKKNISKVSQFGRGDAMADFANKDDAERAIRRSGLTGKAIVLAVKRGQNRVILSPSEAIGRKIWEGDGDKRITLNGEFGAELVEAIGRRGNKQNSLTVPWQFQNTYDRRKALSRLGIETASEYRSAVREFIALKEQAVVNRTKELELQMVGRKADGLDFFPTSSEVADQMIEAADLSPDMAVLEPSAGMGHLADRIREAGAEPDVIEISPERRELLEEKGYHLAQYDDFLQMEPRKFFTYGDLFRAPDGKEGTMRGVGRMGSQRVRLEDENGNRLGLYDRDELTGIGHRGTWSGYDRIIMNPPFSNRRDAEHVMHAYTLLKPGGRIVAIMGEGVFFGQDKKAQEFRDWLESVGGTSEKLPAGSFMDPSLPVNTSVNARMVVIDKPAGDLVLPSRDDAGAGAKFSQGLLSQPSNAPQPSFEAVQRFVDKFQKVAKEVLPITVVRHPGKVPGIKAPVGTKPTGAVVDGHIYLFADNMMSPGDVMVTVFHELFHLGLQKVIPAEDYAALLRSFANNALVQKFVRQWKASPEGVQRAAKMPSAAYESLAAEEALAMVSEELFANGGVGTAPRPALVKRMLSWLAEVADKIGLPGNFGEWIRGLTRTDAERFAGEMVRAMMGGQKNLARTRAKYGTVVADLTNQDRLRLDATEQELADLFKALEAPRGLKLTQAHRAIDQHPMSAKIREVESNFLDILERLDDAGLVQINC